MFNRLFLSARLSTVVDAQVLHKMWFFHRNTTNTKTLIVRRSLINDLTRGADHFVRKMMSFLFLVSFSAAPINLKPLFPLVDIWWRILPKNNIINFVRYLTARLLHFILAFKFVDTLSTCVCYVFVFITFIFFFVDFCALWATTAIQLTLMPYKQTRRKPM